MVKTKQGMQTKGGVAKVDARRAEGAAALGKGMGGAGNAQAVRGVDVVARMEGLLREEIVCQEALLGAVRRKMAALKKADHQAVAACCQEENRQVQKLSDTAKERLKVAGELTKQLKPEATTPMRLGELAELMAEPGRSRLLVLRAQLKARMEEVKSESATARRVTEALVRHMVGLIQNVGSAISGVSTYGRRGMVSQGAGSLSTLSVTA